MAALTISDSKVTEVGGLRVQRALPERERRTVGAWCFLDRFGPTDVTPSRTMAVGPHPHMGLHTVTWLLDGEVLHSDSLGNQQLIRAGQLNLMSSGHGIAHAEDARSRPNRNLDGVQLWVAQPEATRRGPPSFAHHGDLPLVELGTGTATILCGEFAGARSAARTDTPLLGLDIAASGAVDLPLDPAFEYGISVLHGGARIAGSEASPNQFMYLGSGREGVQLDLAVGSRLLVLGGEPFAEDIVMWWNFVARDRAEFERARADWEAHGERFGDVTSTLDRIPAPRPYWVT